jgi:hypothetical protein
MALSNLRNLTIGMVLRRKILFSMLASFAIIFALFVSSFGSVSAFSNPNLTGYQAGSGLGSVTYVAGSFSKLSWSDSNTNVMKEFVGIDVNPKDPSITGVQVGVKVFDCSSSAVCEYRPFFVYGGVVHLFAIEKSVSGDYFMSIQYFANSKTFVLYFFDQIAGKAFQERISALGYSRQHADWMLTYLQSYANFQNAYSGGQFTSFPQTDYAVILGQYLPLEDLPNLAIMQGSLYTFITSISSFYVLGGG